MDNMELSLSMSFYEIWSLMVLLLLVVQNKIVNLLPPPPFIFMRTRESSCLRCFFNLHFCSRLNFLLSDHCLGWGSYSCPSRLFLLPINSIWALTLSYIERAWKEDIILSLPLSRAKEAATDWVFLAGFKNWCSLMPGQKPRCSGSLHFNQLGYQLHSHLSVYKTARMVPSPWTLVNALHEYFQHNCIWQKCPHAIVFSEAHLRHHMGSFYIFDNWHFEWMDGFIHPCNLCIHVMEKVNTFCHPV